MSASRTALTLVSGRTPVVPLPASSPKRPGGDNGTTSAELERSHLEACRFQLPLAP